MKALISFIMIAFATLAANADNRQSFEGYYWNQNKSAIIQLTLDGDSIKGFTAWSDGPDTITDTQNPDPALRDRPIIGMTFLWGFEYADKKNRWKDGKIYDPNNGKTYDAKLSLKENGNILEMRGYVGISLLGRTVEMERVSKEDMPATLIKTAMPAS